MDLSDAEKHLDACAAALKKLDAACCEPGRSPRMKQLGETIGLAKESLPDIIDEDGAAPVLTWLEDAGAMVGRLQVGCCAEDRLPLYEKLLAGLTGAQLAVNRALGLGH